jgi:hypothetical protein
MRSTGGAAVERSVQSLVQRERSVDEREMRERLRGKLPICSPVSAISSEKSPTWLA